MQRKEKGDHTESGYRGNTNQGEKDDNKESGNGGYTKKAYHKGRKRATIKKTDEEAIQMKGTAVTRGGRQQGERIQRLKSRVPPREKKDDHKESGYRGYTNQG